MNDDGGLGWLLEKVRRAQPELKGKGWLTWVVSMKLQQNLINPPEGMPMIPRSNNPFDYEDYTSSALNLLASLFQENTVLGLQRDFRRPKSNKKSSKLREQGNSFFRSSNDLLSLERALECYTKCIAYAKAHSEEIALGYSNRSYVLLRLNRPKECLEDIERALRYNYALMLKAKLYARQGEAYAKLAEQSYIAAKYWLNEVPVRDSDRNELARALKDYSASKYKSTIDQDPEVPVIERPHSKIPYISDAIEIEHFGPFDRKIIATRDIELGEIIVLEEAYSLLQFEKFFYTHCSFCLSSFWAGIPCHACVNAVYCSEKCRQLAWMLYHNFECPVLDLLMVDDNADSMSRVQSARCPRLLLQMCHEAGGLRKLKERVRDFHNRKFDDKELHEKWYRERSLETVLLTNANVERISEARLMHPVKTALTSLFYLVTNTDFFGFRYNRDSMSDVSILKMMSINSDIKFAGAFLINLGLIQQSNGFTKNELIADDLSAQRRGSQVIPLKPPFKFSCHANVGDMSTGNKCVMYATLPVKKGEQLTSACGPSWMIQTKQERSEHYNQMCITCDCIACKDDWPLLEQMNDYKKQAKSRAARQKVESALSSYEKLLHEICNGDIPDKAQALQEIRRLLRTVEEGVNLPCQEYCKVANAVVTLFRWSFNVSKMRKLFGEKGESHC